MKRCAIYARFSTEMQRAASLEDQIRNCRRFAAQSGWEILDDHQDSAVSGFGVEHRPAYQRLVAASLATVPPFTVILVDDLSRLSRDLVETLKLYRRLQRHGVELVAVADGIQTTEYHPMLPWGSPQGVGEVLVCLRDHGLTLHESQKSSIRT